MSESIPTNATVMMVEDEAVSRVWLDSLIGEVSPGASRITVCTVHEAIEALSSRPIDVALVDVGLPTVGRDDPRHRHAGAGPGHRDRGGMCRDAATDRAFARGRRGLRGKNMRRARGKARRGAQVKANTGEVVRSSTAPSRMRRRPR